MDTGMNDRIVVITGASGGIGGATAREFAREGAKLALHGHTRMERVDELAEELPVDCTTHKADLTNPTETEDMFNKVRSRLGPPDALVANAGIWPSEEVPIKDMSLERWQNTITTDQTSVFLCSREYFRILQNSDLDKASLVIVGSTAAVFGEENHADYSAAKAAITYGLTRSLKNEIVRIAPEGRVNAICPGWTKTEMATPEMQDTDSVKDALKTRSLRSIGHPEDMARSIVFLSSHRLAGHITGQVLTVAGGMEGRLLHG
ncbi:MAG: SDR family oxidoreductase [Candidatus Bipolaricaulota bacterium]|nr:SDR family oxidoreductase [Candidatus Bipolaricaulota bacterium]MBS3791406.1 SDR family oxidoreductase [Candidatus Bipolaricaulota bacterium]